MACRLSPSSDLQQPVTSASAPSAVNLGLGQMGEEDSLRIRV